MCKLSWNFQCTAPTKPTPHSQGERHSLLLTRDEERSPERAHCPAGEPDSRAVLLPTGQYQAGALDSSFGPLCPWRPHSCLSWTLSRDEHNSCFCLLHPEGSTATFHGTRRSTHPPACLPAHCWGAENRGRFSCNAGLSRSMEHPTALQPGTSVPSLGPACMPDSVAFCRWHSHWRGWNRSQIRARARESAFRTA
jgi:hypothetical protein